MYFDPQAWLIYLLLIICGDGMNYTFPTTDIRSKVMVDLINLLCSGSHFVHSNHMEGYRIVFKWLTMNLRRNVFSCESMTANLFQKLHNRYYLAKCLNYEVPDLRHSTRLRKTIKQCMFAI